MTAIIITFFLIASLFPTGACRAGTSNAAGKVRTGIEDFQRGDFKAAAEAFAKAESDAPDDRCIAFNRGCAYLAQKEFDKAVEQFQQSAVAADKKLAAESSYNLGCTMVDQAKAQFKGKPEEAEGETRTQSLESLLSAAKYYRSCLTVDPEHAHARYNLETLRLWIKHIQDVWKHRDREKRRREMNLLQFLEMLETEQRALRTTAQELDPLGSSPRKREAVRALEESQRLLAEEIEPLKQKIDAALKIPPLGSPPAPATDAAAPPSADVQKAAELLRNLADEALDRMSEAAGDLAAQELQSARTPQARAVEKIDQIFMVVAPYVNLVQKGIRRQESLVQLSERSAAAPAETDEKAGTKPPPSVPSQPKPFDAAEAAWDQKFIEDYGRILPGKARRELEQLEKQAPAGPPSETADSAASLPTPPEGKDEKANALLAAQEQRRELKKALQLGIELAPKVEGLAAEAADLLEQEKPAEALPKQREALKLLKEMLPKQPPQPKQDQKQQQNQQNQKDQKEQDQKNQKQDQKKQDQKDKSEQDQKDKKDQQQNKSQDQKQQDQEKDKKEQKSRGGQTDQKRKMTPEQAKAVCRKARARQDEHRELKKAVEAYLYRPEKVEKDW